MHINKYTQHFRNKLKGNLDSFQLSIFCYIILYVLDLLNESKLLMTSQTKQKYNEPL